MDKPRVMLVDDEERLLSTSKRLFERLNVEVLTACGGREALALLAKHDVDIVFLDVKMPGMDGLEVLPRIKQAYPDVDVYLLTGHSSVDDAVEGIRLGALDYILKPVSVSELLEIINKPSSETKSDGAIKRFVHS